MAPQSPVLADFRARVDRKSTRLNSSHLVTSYAVFCLKKTREQAGVIICVRHVEVGIRLGDFLQRQSAPDLHTLSLPPHDLDATAMYANALSSSHELST